MRVFLSAVLAVCLCGLTTAREDKKPTVEEQLKALQKQFQEDQAGLIKEYEAAKAEKEKEPAPPPPGLDRSDEQSQYEEEQRLIAER